MSGVQQVVYARQYHINTLRWSGFNSKVGALNTLSRPTSSTIIHRIMGLSLAE